MTEPRRKSRRLNPDQPTDLVYQCDSRFDKIKKIWPGKSSIDFMDWMMMNEREEDEEEEKELQNFRLNINISEICIQLPSDMADVMKNNIVEYILVFFQLPHIRTTTLIDESEYVNPRRNRGFGQQIYADKVLNTYCHYNYLMPHVWRIIVTDYDLMATGFNFLLGMSGGVTCIASTNRIISKCDDSDKAFIQICQLIVHEMGHNMGLIHCTVNECIMNGCNSVKEALAAPPDMCPKCLTYVKKFHECHFMNGFDYSARYTGLINILKERNLQNQANFLLKMKSALL